MDRMSAMPAAVQVEMEDVVRRYADYQYNKTQQNDHLKKYAGKVKAHCDRVVQLFIRGFITVDEAMNLLCETMKSVV